PSRSFVDAWPARLARHRGWCRGGAAGRPETGYEAMTATASPAGAPPTYGGARLLLITVALILGPLVQVFDTATVSIALRHMQGELSATQDQIAWVISSYLITLTVFTPIWG